MKMRAALRHLCQNGIEALKPQKVQSKGVTIENYVAKASKEIWHRPKVSKRVAKDLRKQALRDGTYGSFDATTGVGWDPSWDLILSSNQYNVSRYGRIFPPKLTISQRNREGRATKIDEQMEKRDERLEEYYVEREKSRVKEPGFEAYYKRLSKGGPGGGAGQG